MCPIACFSALIVARRQVVCKRSLWLVEPTSPTHLSTLLENDMIADECFYEGRQVAVTRGRVANEEKTYTSAPLTDDIIRGF